MTISRRDFIKLTGATAFCACAGAVGIWGCSGSGPASRVPLAPAESYRREGGRVIISLAALGEQSAAWDAVRLPLGGEEDPGRDIIILRLGEAVYRAFPNRCTHRGKELVYAQEEMRLECQSGKSHFDLRGDVFQGPAESPLVAIAACQEGDQLIITP